MYILILLEINEFFEIGNTALQDFYKYAYVSCYIAKIYKKIGTNIC